MLKAKRLLALLLAAMMVLSLVACSNEKKKDDPVTNEVTDTPTVAPTEAPKTETKDDKVVLEKKSEVSIDFEDGKIDFIKPYMVPANAAEVELSVVDFNGSKALQVKNVSEKVPYIGVDVASLCKDKAADIAKIEMTMGISYADGTFSACSGNVITWTGDNLLQTKLPWSVYLAKKNPKLALVELKEKFVNNANNIFVISLETDNGLADGHGAATLYIDDICFYDAAGKLITADNTAVFENPEGFENTDVDMTHLLYLKDAVNIEGFACKADAWAQAGVDITDDMRALLVPGSVIEIEFTSETGDLWMVVTDAPNGWTRAGGQKTLAINSTGSVAQITYEQLMAFCGTDDITAIKGQLQCESDSAWEVYSVKIGTNSGLTELRNKVVIDGMAVKGDAWAQAGIDITDDIRAMLVPGSVIEIEYASETGDMWMVITDAPNGWTRAGGQNTTRRNGKVCQISYEELMNWCGTDDITAIKGQIQCESDAAWEVFSVSVGTPANLVPVAGLTPIDGFACKADAWAQAGVDITDDMRALLVPGSVIEITYTSESGDMWAVITDGPNGWTRAGGQNTTRRNGSICQITYDELMQWCVATEVSEIKGQLQGESDTAWEVYKVSIGTEVK